MYRTAVSVIYGCETGSLTVRVEHTQWLFKNKVLRVFLLVIAYSIVIWPQIEQRENLGLIPDDGGDMQVCSRDI
jgi:hypothetical protein